MKKLIIEYTLSIIGFALQCFGIGFMLYGINGVRLLLWIGFPLLIVGMLLVLIGVISKKEK